MSSEQAKAKQAQFGMIGLAVMGRNLALNVEEHGFPVAVWNLETEWVDSFVSENSGKQFVGTKTVEDFVHSLERPRRMMMMIRAGKPVDLTIERIKPLMEEGDILIDGGNSYFKDTQRREAALRNDGLRFVGSGVSGGEDGARHGPSLMPGGAREAYEHIRPVLQGIAAKTDSGACVTYVGPDGAGHFVKMVHNGIEYGDMQLIAEAYDVMRNGFSLTADEMADVFEEWNEGELESYLIEITAKILRVKDPETGKPLVDMVLDEAGQKGTGKWASQLALDLGIPIPTIDAAITARNLSARKSERVAASKIISVRATGKYSGLSSQFKDVLRDALYASKICSYAQGMNLIKAGSDEFKWNINLSEVARIWQGGCIIRARFLKKIKEAYLQDARLKNLLLDEAFNSRMESAQPNWRIVVS